MATVIPQSETQKLLSELARAKAVFQQRTIKAVLEEGKE